MVSSKLAAPPPPLIGGKFKHIIPSGDVVNYFSKPVTSLENYLNWCIINKFQDNGTAHFSVDLKNYISSKEELEEVKAALFKKGYRFPSKTERFIVEGGKVIACDLHFYIPSYSE